MEPRFNSSGYPVEESLKAIATWDFSKLPLEAFLAYIKELWTYQDRWGQTKKRLRLSTGGWSGNEQLIGAMQENYMFWIMCWEQSRRGGHYIFDFSHPPMVSVVKDKDVMMEASVEHTPEPWSYDLLSVTPAVYGKQMLSIIGDNVVNKSDARRIVACVNACKDIPTDTLEIAHLSPADGISF